MGSGASRYNYQENVYGYVADLKKEIRSGSFGTVYKGRDTHRNNTIVAMKKLHKLGNRRAAISTEAVRWHYLKEKIIHDHIVKVHAVKYFNSAMWITMEYVTWEI